MLARDKHSNLLWNSENYCRNKCYDTGSWSFQRIVYQTEKNKLSCLLVLSNSDKEKKVLKNFQQYAHKCVYEEAVYNNGDQWSATHETCKMCSCIK
jgi:hypothetical protein